VPTAIAVKANRGFNITKLRGIPRLKYIVPAAAWYITIIVFSFPRPARKTEHEQRSSTALPKARNAGRVRRMSSAQLQKFQ
jgi:hypothetical protein